MYSYNDENLLINGDNLTILSELKDNSKSPFINVVMIDPPYNVGGNQGYKNNWSGVSITKQWAGSHGKFLDFMEPRLSLSREMLTDDGMIFINICDGEYCHLKILMDEIFGNINYVGTIIWDKNQGAPSSHITTIHEYILIYAKCIKTAPKLMKYKNFVSMSDQKISQLIKDENEDKIPNLFKKWVSDQHKLGTISGGDAQYKYITKKPYRIYQADPTCAHDDLNMTRCRIPLIHPITKKPCAVPKHGWKWCKSTLDKMVIDNKFIFGTDHTTIPRVIRYLDDRKCSTPPSIIKMASTGKNDLGNSKFLTPKPVELIKELLSYYPNKNAVVIDYFAGSGTTACAVTKLNESDNGTRKWIMIEQDISTFNDVLYSRLASSR